MPTFVEVAKLATRTVIVDLRGIKFTVTENLFRDPTLEVDVRKNAREALAAMRAISRRVKVGEGSFADEDMTAQLDSLEAQLGMDDRSNTCRAVANRFIDWDVLDENEKPLPLEADTLYESKCPTQFFKDLMDAVDKEPLVPNGKA